MQWVYQSRDWNRDHPQPQPVVSLYNNNNKKKKNQSELNYSIFSCEIRDKQTISGGFSSLQMLLLRLLKYRIYIYIYNKHIVPTHPKWRFTAVIPHNISKSKCAVPLSLFLSLFDSSHLSVSLHACISMTPSGWSTPHWAHLSDFWMTIAPAALLSWCKREQRTAWLAQKRLLETGDTLHQWEFRYTQTLLNNNGLQTMKSFWLCHHTQIKNDSKVIRDNKTMRYCYWTVDLSSTGIMKKMSHIPIVQITA